MTQTSVTLPSLNPEHRQDEAVSPPRFMFIPRFFSDCESLRAQFEWRVSITRKHGKSVFAESTQEGVFRLFKAAADRVFTQKAIMGFLSHLRQWGGREIRAWHASSPEVLALVRHCWRSPIQDASPANWRYLYTLGPNKADSVTRISLVEPKQVSGLFAVSRSIKIDALSGSLLVYESNLACSLDVLPHASQDLICATVFLAGHLW
jgi:hypothetical protein